MPRKDRPCKLCSGKRYGLSSWCKTHHFERQEKRRKETKAKKLARKLASKKYQQSELKAWRNKTWRLMSEWVRKSRADWKGYAECYTCRAKLPWREMHCGHHFHGKLDFDPRNLRVQDAACNTYRGGMLNIYAKRLIQQYGLQWYEQLEQDAARHPGYTLEEIKKIHSDLTDKLSKLLRR